MSAIILNFVNRINQDANSYFLMQVIYSSFREHSCVFSNGWMVVVTNQAPPSHCGTHANRHLATPDELHKIKIIKTNF